MEKHGAVSTTSNRSERRTATMTPPALEPYTGAWTAAEAAHLLRRVGFGPTYEEIQWSVSVGLNATLDTLFEKRPEPTPPINYYFNDDPLVPVGETWIDKEITRGVRGLITARNRSLMAWLVGYFLDGPIHVEPKLTLFWHNLLVVANIANPHIRWIYWTMLRENALGNYRTLIKKVTIDPAMLFYLNGNENTAQSPNENYARELLELFTIGKGPLAGPGDYTNYTEQDIQEIARALTGWRVNGRQYRSIFVSRRHDKGVKRLSHRFGNAKIPNLEEKEYERVVDIIFEQEEVSRFIVRKLYRWYVHYDITEEVEKQVIEPLASLLRQEDYAIEPVLRTLFGSAHFYDSCVRGVMVRSPMDYLFTLLRTGEVPMPEKRIEKYFVWERIGLFLIREEQFPFRHPSVAGWPAYYQEPVYYRIWLSSVSLPNRKTWTDNLVDGRYRFRRRYKIGMDLLGIVHRFSAPEDPDRLIEELNTLFLPYPLTDAQRQYLKKEVLLPGLPDYEWTVEWDQYKSNPDDENARMAVLNRLRALMKVMLNMPEHQLM